ncbi:MAG: hypothetical protein D6730_10430 [Bacteroidetes bacterium]|nr:MAG: hypothetical protein D6730_10430 [Bacteroidota bacterium]
MDIELIDIADLYKLSRLSPARCADFSEAAAVCLEVIGHRSGRIGVINGDFQRQFKFVWAGVSEQMIHSRSDMGDTVESGAYCMAMLVVEKLTGLMVVKQSQKRTGFDYWLSNKQKNVGFQGMARLEVSGILRGSKGQINQRIKEKMEQTKKSDNLSLPAYVVVVEFSQLLIHIKIRSKTGI